MSRRMLIAGNWKMNGQLSDLGYFSDLPELVSTPDAEIIVCPPFPLLPASIEAAKTSFIVIGAQDCHGASSGAHTGDVSAKLLAGLGVQYVIVGHSERRADHGETDAMIRSKAEAAIEAGLTPIICVGETLEQRQAGQAVEVVAAQLAGSVPKTGEYVVAYEPVWAIGTGLVAELEDIAQMHDEIRTRITRGETTRILYGGSVKPDNCHALMQLDDVDGALVGGASLKAQSFAEIIKNTLG